MFSGGYTSTLGSSGITRGCGIHGLIHRTSIPQVDLIAKSSLLLVWAAGFKTCGAFVLPSIMTNEALYYPLEVRSRAWVVLFFGWGRIFFRLELSLGCTLSSPARRQHIVCAARQGWHAFPRSQLHALRLSLFVSYGLSVLSIWVNRAPLALPSAS